MNDTFCTFPAPDIGFQAPSSWGACCRHTLTLAGSHGPSTAPSPCGSRECGTNLGVAAAGPEKLPELERAGPSTTAWQTKPCLLPKQGRGLSPVTKARAHFSNSESFLLHLHQLPPGAQSQCSTRRQTALIRNPQLECGQALKREKPVRSRPQKI